MRSQFAKWMLALALIFSIGAQWTFLQSVAWVGMIVRYSQEAPVVTAVKMTFDGQHPCGLCKAVQKGRDAEKQSHSTKSEGKFLFVASIGSGIDLLYLQFDPVSPAIDLTPSRSEPPPFPPPRLA